MIYQSGASSNIGTLLRLIQEEKSKNIAAIPPQADVESPLRASVQEPIKAPESPGTQRVVSIRPEGATMQGPVAGSDLTPVAPVAAPTPVGPASSPMSNGPIEPSSSPSQPGMARPSVSGMSAPMVRGASVTGPRLGTVIGPAGMSMAPPRATGAYQQAPSQVTPSRGWLSVIGGGVKQAVQKAPSLATRVMPEVSTLAKRLPGVGAALSAIEIGSSLIKKRPELLSPGGTYARRI